MSKELATQRRDIRTILAAPDMAKRISEVIPKYLTPEIVTRVALVTIGRNDKLGKCTPESLLNSVMLCAQAGLIPDGRYAHLIPYGDQCTVIFDYKGLVFVAEKNGVSNIRAVLVHDHDEFDFRIEDGKPVLHHKIDWKKDRGSMYAVYGTCYRDDGKHFDVEVMTKAEVDAIRKRSKSSGSGPWVTDYNEMAKKTVLRRMSKRWPLAPELATALDEEADRETERKPAGPTVKEANFASQILPGAGDAGAGTTTEPPPPVEPPDDIPMEHEGDKPVETETQTQETPTEKPAPVANCWEGLRNLVAASRITEAQLLEFCKAQNFGTFKKLGDIPPARVKNIVGDWQDVLEGIKGMAE